MKLRKQLTVFNLYVFIYRHKCNGHVFFIKIKRFYLLSLTVMYSHVESGDDKKCLFFLHCRLLYFPSNAVFFRHKIYPKVLLSTEQYFYVERTKKYQYTST